MGLQHLKPFPSSPVFARAAGVLVMLIGSIALLGGAIHLPTLQSVSPGLTSMKANAALAFIVAGLAMLLSLRQPSNHPPRPLGRLLALFLVVLGGLTLLEYLGGWDLGIDQLLITDPVHLPDTPYGGRMAPIAALGFLLAGAALLILPIPQRARLGQVGAIGVGLVGLLNVMGYVYGAQVFAGYFFYTRVALPAAVAFLLLSLGLLYLVPDRGLMAAVTSPSSGGVLTRRLLPAAVVVPFVVGWMCLTGQRAGLYGTAFALVLFALVNTMVFTSLIWWTVRALYRLDIKRQQAEDALRESAAQFRLLFADNPLPMWVHDRETLRFLEVNEAAVAHYGYSRSEFLQLHLPDIRPPDIVPRVLAEVAPQRLAAQQAGEGRHQLKSGAVIDVAVVSHLISYEDHPAYLVVINDITERQRTLAELRLRARQQESVAALGQRVLAAPTLDSLLAEAITLAASGLNVDYVALSELTPDSQSLVLRSVVGWSAAYVGQIRVPVDRTNQAGYTLLENRPVILDEQHPQPSFGISSYVRTRGVISAISVVVPGAERPFGVLVAHSTRRRAFPEHDIQYLQSIVSVLAAGVERERHLAARAAHAAAEQASLAKNEFLSRMSHELRTPLNAILGFGQLLEREPLLPAQAESVSYVLRAGQHLLSLINEVLDITRIEAGQLALSSEPVLLQDILRESLEMVQPSAAQYQVQINTTNLARATQHILADQQRLKQVLLNLLSNAIKYNRPAGTVYISWEDRPGARLRIVVRDTGLGILTKDLPRLFTPFERLGAEQTGVEGTGLGLALSRQLMEAMGGAIGVESNGGQGSTFWVELPLVASPVAALIAPVEAVAVTTRGESEHTVLFIDDNLSNLRLVERILEVRPHIRILPALQGQVGLDLARQHRPDLVLLDLHLPDLPGEEVLRRLQGEPATVDIPVIILSADATPGQVARLRQAGAYDYLTKPFRVQAFLTLIDQVLAEETVISPV